MEGVDGLDLNATIAQMVSKRQGKKNVKSESKKKTGERRKKKTQSVAVDQESLLGYEEGQKDDAPPGITVSAFDYSAENYLNVVDKICKLCGQAKSDDLDENEIERLSSFVTFVREWRHFTYPPRAIRFSHQSVSSPQGKDVTGGMDLPQFSAATVPKNGLQNGNMLCQEPSNDFVMNVGGLVWALDWCPRVHQRCESSDCHVNCEFIAVAAHPPESSYHKVGAPLIGRGVIQIWCLLNIGVKEEEVPRTKNKATQNQSSSTGKATSPNESRTRGRPRKNRVNESADNLDENSEYVQPKKPRGRPKNKPVTESLDNLSGNNELYVQALAVQFPENAPNLLPIDTIRENTSECVANKVSGTTLKACRRGSDADNLVLETSVKRRRLKAMAREGNFVDPDQMPLLTENENVESSVQDPLESSAASCVIPKDVALPRVVLCLAHNGKVAWDVKWRPSFVNDAESNHRMGYLAVLLGNGALEVWEVPLPQTIKAIYSACQTEGTDPRFMKLEPVFRCSKLKSGDRQSIPLTVEWSASAPHDFILAGCHDGVVALWKFSANDRSEDTKPLLCFSADTVPIRGLAWAPVESDSESANVIVTAGHKGIKFWDIRDPFCPLWDLNPVQRNIYSMDWLPDPRCVIVSFDDGTLRILSLVKAAYDVPVTGKPFVGTQQQGFHSYYCSSFAIWSVQVSRLTGIVLLSYRPTSLTLAKTLGWSSSTWKGKARAIPGYQIVQKRCVITNDRAWLHIVVQTVLFFVSSENVHELIFDKESWTLGIGSERLTAREVEKDPRRNRAPHFLCGSLTEEESTLTINTPLPDTPFPMKKSLNEWSNAPRTIRGYLSKSNQARRAKEQMSKGQPSDSQTLALCYGDDPGTEIGSEDELVLQKSKQTPKSKASSKKKRGSNQALVCRDEEPEDFERGEGQEGEIREEIEVFPPKMVAMHRVRWNMNKGSERWLCSGGAAGIVRCQAINNPVFDKKSPKYRKQTT
ncbi:hypothetical protein RHMOL_Rhmol05G0025300 [Rhododendron molle]|uniref:Uncharacterized protein n=2 Tax=Rhododendron molle TaxID=49168 RepID=A0ACC0NLC8_RHOML|nr:hypothetical protein RHMOL_Rhmol05G0025300 [Rhododendron molle]KAI8553562.1 hypothetical protein RHMOL_Rhmol05G0025300 [Rhododendron molle]